MILTTDQMDHTTAAERDKLAGMCGNCGEWTKGTRAQLDEPCSHCSGKILQHSIRSQRTFNDEQAKKETAKLRKKR